MPDEIRERLRCPVCGYEEEREEHPALIHCGPHLGSDGMLTPAVRMRRARYYDLCSKAVRLIIDVDGRVRYTGSASLSTVIDDLALRLEIAELQADDLRGAYRELRRREK